MKTNIKMEKSKSWLQTVIMIITFLTIISLVSSCDYIDLLGQLGDLSDDINTTTSTTIAESTTTSTIASTTTSTVPGTTTTTTSTTIADPDPDIYEPDDTKAATSNTITPGDAMQDHTFHISYDYDWIICDLSGVTPGTTILIETHFKTIQLDPSMKFYNSSNTEIASNDDYSVDSYYSQIVYKCNTPGLYYLLVEQVDGGTGDYGIDIKELQLNADIYEVDNTSISTTNTMVPGAATQNHTIHIEGDEDWIKLDLSAITAGETIEISTKWLSAHTDTIMYFYDELLNQVAFNDDGNYALYSTITYTCNTPGLYYIKVRRIGNNLIGDYKLDVVIQ